MAFIFICFSCSKWQCTQKEPKKISVELSELWDHQQEKKEEKEETEDKYGTHWRFSNQADWPWYLGRFSYCKHWKQHCAWGQFWVRQFWIVFNIISSTGRLEASCKITHCDKLLTIRMTFVVQSATLNNVGYKWCTPQLERDNRLKYYWTIQFVWCRHF